MVMRRITLFYVNFCMIEFDRKCVFGRKLVDSECLNRVGGGVCVAVLMSRRVKGVCDLSPQRLVSVFFPRFFFFLSFPAF